MQPEREWEAGLPVQWLPRSGPQNGLHKRGFRQCLRRGRTGYPEAKILDVVGWGSKAVAALDRVHLLHGFDYRPRYRHG